MSQDFTDNQKKSIQCFLAQVRESLVKDRLKPQFLLYLITRMADENSEDCYSKALRILLRENIKKKRRVYIDFIISKIRQNKPKPKHIIKPDSSYVTKEEKERESESETRKRKISDSESESEYSSEEEEEVVRKRIKKHKHHKTE